MAHAFRHLIFGALLGLLATCPLAAQVVRFTVFAAKPIAGLAFVPKANAAPVKTVFYPTARSPRYEYRGAMPLRFVDPADNTVVAEVTIPAGIQDALLLFSPAETTGTPAAKGKAAPTLRYQVSVLDDGALRHGAGGLSIVNLSGLELSGVVGANAVILTPGLNPTLSIGKSAKVTLRAAAKGKTVQSYADSIELGPKNRALLILFPPYYKGSLEAQSRLLIDEPPVPAAGRR